MPKVTGIGRSKKRKKLAPVAPTEPMPDKEGELIEDAKEEAEEPEIDSELIEEAACKVEEMILEELMDVSKVVRELMFDLYKCEVAAASIREAMEAKFGVGKSSCFGESAPWFEAYDDALGELRDIYMMSAVSSSVPPAAAALSFARGAVLIVRVGLAICGAPGFKDIDVAFVVRRDLPLSASKNKIEFFGIAPARFF